MFGSNKSTIFKPVPFGQSGRKRSAPRWLLPLLLGLGLGAGALYYVENSLLPPRLSFAASVALKTKSDEAVATRDAAKAQLSQATELRSAAQSQSLGATEKMNAALTSVEPLKKDIELFLRLAPSDPRGNALAVRAGQFTVAAGKLNHHVLLTREKGTEPFRGAMQLAVLGSLNGKEQTIQLEPTQIDLIAYQHLIGAHPLPGGFTPREVTVKVLQSMKGEAQSVRVFRLN
jgi:anti-sigma28 factor (negative regulator of flagellin synthesis)